MHLLFQQYDEKLTRLRRSDSARTNFARTAQLFEEAGLDPMTAQDWEIEEMLVGLPLAASTKQLHHNNLSSAFRYAVQRRMLPASPMETVKLPRVPDAEPHILETDELRAVLRQAVSDQDVLLANLAIYTGMRKNEIRELEWANVKLADCTITVTNGKGSKLRHVPIHPRLAEVLVECGRPDRHATVLAGPRGTALSEKGMSHRLDRIRQGIDCSFHDFRRTVATSLAENGVPEYILFGIMGWAERAVGRKYYIRKADSLMQEAILRLYADDPLESV